MTTKLWAGYLYAEHFPKSPVYLSVLMLPVGLCNEWRGCDAPSRPTYISTAYSDNPFLNRRHQTAQPSAVPEFAWGEADAIGALQVMCLFLAGNSQMGVTYSIAIPENTRYDRVAPLR
ncbi:hypothetical protein GQ53DRAFT_138600 [Thozetella sp. PMI_491]|nr:hypothetical protein GQ53DRAFT_138600 [Thozetella sp. PMI_491]